jgi:hypothetical protein
LPDLRIAEFAGPSAAGKFGNSAFLQFGNHVYSVATAPGYAADPGRI